VGALGLASSVIGITEAMGEGVSVGLMALNVAALSAGRMLGSMTATHLWLHGGLSLSAMVPCGAALAAFALLLLFVPEPGESSWKGS
jgi:hypothetical protein